MTEPIVVVEEEIPVVTFDDLVTGIPFNPTTENGRGFLPPLLRAQGHLLYLLGRMSDTVSRRPSDGQITEELDGAISHVLVADVPIYLTETSKTHISNWKAAAVILRNDIISWEPDIRIENLTKLTNRTLSLSAILDREVLGIPNSDPGQYS